MAVGVDTSIYANQNPNPVASSLNMITGFANAQNAIVSARSNAMQMRARMAMGPILQASVGQDGQIDYDKASVLMASNPDTAWMAPDFINQAVQRQYTQAETIKTKLTNQQTRYSAILGAITPLVALGNDVNSKKVIGATAGLIGEGIVTMPEVMSVLGQLPADGAPLAQWLGQRQLQLAGAAKAIDTVNSGISQVEGGGAVTIEQQVPSLGINRPLATVQKTPTPEQLGAPQEYIGQNQETLTGPRGTIMALPSGSAGAFTPAPGAATGGNAIFGAAGGGAPDVAGGAPANPILQNSGTPMAPPPQGNNAQPVAPNPPPEPVGGARQATGGPVQPGGGGVVTKLSPMDQKVAEGQAAKFTEYQNNLNDFVTQNRTMLQNVNELTNAAKQFQAGPGRSTLAELASVAKAIGTQLNSPKLLALASKLAGGDPGDPAALGAAQEFEKLALQGAMLSLKNAVGGQGRLTNLEFEKFTEANPNLSTDPYAILKITNLLKRITAVSEAEQKALSVYENKHKQDPANFPLDQFRQKWEAELVKRGVISLDQLQPGAIKGTEAAPE